MEGSAMFARHRPSAPKICMAVLLASLLLLNSALPLSAASGDEDIQEEMRTISDLENIDPSDIERHAPSDDDEEIAGAPDEEEESIEAARAARTTPIPRLIHPREIGNRRPGVNFGLAFRQGDFNQEIVIGGGLGWRSKVYYPNINAVVGDVLVFEYKWPFMHTVWLLPRKKCNFIKGVELATINQEGPFRYVLTKKGLFHFGCSVPGHCDGGELFSVRVRE
ncbi:hypothetical protein BSKO_12371 [Bryopsis sp. KO-2023]|nr:hypothetical protein BSKO_12371 [Bryopsis sp. KO-2023]